MFPAHIVELLNFGEELVAFGGDSLRGALCLLQLSLGALLLHGRLRLGVLQLGLQTADIRLREGVDEGEGGSEWLQLSRAYDT